MRFITFMPIVRREGDSIMIFLHTSDWHLGAAAGEKDLIERRGSVRKHLCERIGVV